MCVVPSDISCCSSQPIIVICLSQLMNFLSEHLIGLSPKGWWTITLRERTEFCPMLNNEQFKVPCFNSGYTNAQNNNQTYNCCKQKSLLMWMIEQPNWLRLVLHGEQDQQDSIGQVYWKDRCILLWFLFYEPKWTRTEIVIEITLLPQAYSCLLLVQVAYGFLRMCPEVLVEIILVLVVHCNENPFHHILIYNFII